jgi:hypothetical protein
MATFFRAFAFAAIAAVTMGCTSESTSIFPVVDVDSSAVKGTVLGLTGGSVPFAAGGGSVFGTNGADDGTNTVPPFASSYVGAGPNGNTLVVYITAPVSLALAQRQPAEVSVCVTDQGPNGASENCDRPTATVALAIDTAACQPGPGSAPCLVNVKGTVAITGSSLFEGDVMFTHTERWETYTTSNQDDWGL